MKQNFIFLVSIILLVSCKKNSENLTPNSAQSIKERKTSNQTQEQALVNNPKGKLTEMTFEKTEHNFGEINSPTSVSYSFKFTNSGKNDLVIENAVGSCGCTIPEYPKEPIKPGKSGKIKVSFNSAGKSGEQQKLVTLLVNTKNRTEKLTIRASIKGGLERKQNKNQ